MVAGRRSKSSSTTSSSIVTYCSGGSSRINNKWLKSATRTGIKCDNKIIRQWLDCYQLLVLVGAVAGLWLSLSRIFLSKSLPDTDFFVLLVVVFFLLLPLIVHNKMIRRQTWNDTITLTIPRSKMRSSHVTLARNNMCLTPIKCLTKINNKWIVSLITCVTLLFFLLW